MNMFKLLIQLDKGNQFPEKKNKLPFEYLIEAQSIATRNGNKMIFDVPLACTVFLPWNTHGKSYQFWTD